MISRLEEFLSPMANKLGNQRHLQSISNGMMMSLALIVVLKRQNGRFIVYIGYTALVSGIMTIGIGLISNDLITMVLMRSDVFLDVSTLGDMLSKQFLTLLLMQLKNLLVVREIQMNLLK